VQQISVDIRLIVVSADSAATYIGGRAEAARITSAAAFDVKATAALAAASAARARWVCRRRRRCCSRGGASGDGRLMHLRPREQRRCGRFYLCKQLYFDGDRRLFFPHNSEKNRAQTAR